LLRLKHQGSTAEKSTVQKPGQDVCTGCVETGERGSRRQLKGKHHTGKEQENIVE